MSTARFPEAGGKGDQLRAFQAIKYLSGRHAVTVVTPGEPSSPEARSALAELATVHVVPQGPARRAGAALAALVRGRPGQVGLMMPGRAWRRVATEAAACDVVLANTVRAVTGPLAVPLVIDHVDALSANMRHRARASSSHAMRAAARLEATLLRRWERLVAGWAVAQVVSSSEDAAALPKPPPVTVIPGGWDGPDPEAHENGRRDLDLVLSGNMEYPPNRDAAVWLADEILPEIRRRRPGTRATIVGRSARSLPVDGVEIASDVPDVCAYLRRARVAVVPLRVGTGTPNKLLEAAASGAAIVATPWAAERFGLTVPTATDAPGLAAAVVGLLEDDGRRRAQVSATASVVTGHSARALAARVERVLATASRQG